MNSLRFISFVTTGIASLFFLLAPITAAAQTDSAPGWYLGLQGGTAFGQCTFRSISDHHTRIGFEGGIFLGRQFNRFLSADVNAVFGSMKMDACDCCPYWLSADGQRCYAPILDGQGWAYSDITATTGFQRFGLQVNVDMLRLLYNKGTRWSVRLSPQCSAIHTSTDLNTAEGLVNATSLVGSSQWHLGLGGQLSAGYDLTRTLSLSLFGGISYLSGDRFDTMPEHGHNTNIIYDAGLRLTYHLNR